MKYSFIFYAMIISVLLLGSFVSAEMKTITYNTTAVDSTTSPALALQVLKYDPYPVNGGGWFDLWVKVQNIGQNDAPNVRFQLVPDYPFSSEDNLVRDYGLIYGTANAYKVSTEGDASQVILKFRVKVAENAPEGDSNIKLVASTNVNDPHSITFAYNLPISIAKTKTDFDILMQDSTAQGVSFAVANTGTNDASAVTVSVEPSDTVKVMGSSSSILGNMAKGDFTTVTFPIMANKNLQEVTIKVAYTDIAGIRETIEKTVPVYITNGTALNLGYGNRAAATTTSSRYLYIILGIILGGAAVAFYMRMRRKK